MSKSIAGCSWRALLLVSSAFPVSCTYQSTGQGSPTQPAQTTPATAAAPNDPPAERKAEVKQIGPNVYFGRSGERRWVEIHAEVCLRKGYLEHLLSRTQASKMHESVLTAELDASHIHTALLLTGAKPGRPVQFINEKGEQDFKPPSGDKIKITVRYKDENGKEVELPAKRWVRQARSKKELAEDWVFAGSQIVRDAEGQYYAANDGRVICTSNFTTALLDLPIKSEEGDPSSGLDYEANEPLIPALGTKVIAVLEPLKK